MLNVFEHAVEEPREGEDHKWFAVETGTAYPATVAHILDVLEKEVQQQGYLNTLLGAARQLPAEAWDHALLAKDQVAEDQLTARAQALDITRKWFTEMLHTAVGGPIGVHLTKNLTYKI